MQNYEQLTERISQASGLTKEEIDRKVEAKRAKLSGLVSKEGAAQIVAAELGINFEKEKMKISELMQGMKKANIVGKVISMQPVRAYNKNGKEGKVANLNVADESGSVKTVLWDTNHIALVESGKIIVGSVVEITNGQIRNGELHIGSFSDIKVSNQKIDGVIEQKTFSASCLKDAKSGQGMKTRAVIVQLYEPRYFEVCPECGKKVVDNECKVHGKVEPKRRALMNFVLDDGTDSLRCVLFGDQIYQLGLSEEEVFNIDKFLERKNDVLGQELVFSGNVRTNAFSNSNEFNIEKVEKVDVNALVQELEAKA
jgi:ssDNA-binding replication factor A large subunit